MNWLLGLLIQDALYWAPPQRDGFGGYVWGDPIGVKSRWESRETITYSPEGSEVVASTIVWVDTDVLQGGYLLKGNINDINELLPPNDDAAQIINVKIMEGLIDNSIVSRRALLR